MADSEPANPSLDPVLVRFADRPLRPRPGRLPWITLLLVLAVFLGTGMLMPLTFGIRGLGPTNGAVEDVRCHRGFKGGLSCHAHWVPDRGGPSVGTVELYGQTRDVRTRAMLSTSTGVAVAATVPGRLFAVMGVLMGLAGLVIGGCAVVAGPVRAAVHLVRPGWWPRWIGPTEPPESELRHPPVIRFAVGLGGYCAAFLCIGFIVVAVPYFALEWSWSEP